MKTVLGIQLDKELSEVLGGSRSLVSVMKNRGTPPYEECVAMAIEKNISLDWLILGRGEKEVAGDAAAAPVPPHLVQLPFLDVEDVELRENESWYVARGWLGLHGLAADATVAVRVKGDAMEPSLSEGQIVLIDLEEQKADGVYLVQFGGAGAARFRRLQNLADGSVRVSCDNPAYAPEVVPATARSQLKIIGYCHSVMQAVR